jgi:hypothetical protein
MRLSRYVDRERVIDIGYGLEGRGRSGGCQGTLLGIG